MQWKVFLSYIGYLPKPERERIQDAFQLCKTVHKNQKRLSGEPYSMHPIAVARILAEMHADADTLIAALLHDTVEDTDLTLAEIDTKYNGSVASLIDGVTKLEPEDVAGSPNLDDQIETIRKVFTVMEEDVRVMIIKLVDRLHNMQTIEFLAPERQKKMAQETLDVYVKIADRISMQDLRDELEELCLKILTPQEYQQLLAIKKNNMKYGRGSIETMKEKLRKENPIRKSDYEIHYEPKPWTKLRAQLRTGDNVATGISTLTAVFIGHSISECYEILGALHQLWPRETLSFQDYINAPMINGYRGLHTTIILENGLRVRCKIRTAEMQHYARKGIASQCFDSEKRGFMEYLLPWTKRISTLTEDTARQSQEFWDSLQSDILGESIVIHSSNDEHILLPQGATALDGAFYCFHKDALRLKTVRVNGKPVPFNTRLTHAASLSIDISNKRTVERDWLQQADTGFATAMIRQALSEQSQSKKHSEGKQLLQDVMTKHKKGFVEEFNEKSLLSNLESAGYHSLDEAYEAVANGHLDQNQLYQILFHPSARQKNAMPFVLSFVLDLSDIDALVGIIALYKRFRIPARSIRISPQREFQCDIKIKHKLSPQTQRSFLSELRSIGAKNIRLDPSSSNVKFVLGISVLLTLWGFDPAIAHLLIHSLGTSPIDLTLLRFWSLACISGLLVFLQTYRRKSLKTHVPLKNSSLWLSVFLMIAISLMSYLSLQGTQPVHYTIPMTAAGIVLTSIVNRKRYIVLTITWLALFAGFAIILVSSPDWSWNYVLYTLLAVIAFSLFSVISERYKRQENIQARAGQYFFVLSLACTVITLPLIAFATIHQLAPEEVLLISLFSILFAGLPYYIYYYLLSHAQIDFVLRYSFLIIFTTMIGQTLFSVQAPSIDALTYLSGLLVTFGALLPMIIPRKTASV